MTSKHTPGPWKWHAKSIDQAHNGSVYSEHRPGHAYAVAMQPRYVTDEDWAANAKLIVAAPDLLAALQDAEKRLRGAGMLGGEDDPVCAALAHV